MAERLLRSTVNTLFIGSIPINAFSVLNYYINYININLLYFIKVYKILKSKINKSNK
jgi:hypothetical protein